MKKNVVSLLGVILVTFVMVGCTKTTDQTNTSSVNTTNTANTTVTNTASTANDVVANTTTNTADPMCDWVEASDVIIHVKFADGVVKDGAYEAGFYTNAITSTMRVARSQCDYRTGFSYEELANKGVVELGVRGYTDSVRRAVAGEPISIIIDANGVPDIGSLIEATITN